MSNIDDMKTRQMLHFYFKIIHNITVHSSSGLAHSSGLACIQMDTEQFRWISVLVWNSEAIESLTLEYHVKEMYGNHLKLYAFPIFTLLTVAKHA